MEERKEAKDQKERDQIINEIDKNIFVVAGAGSGKTTSLVSRMVTMVRKGIDVSQISAITFTKAAAVEFYKRFEEKLSEAANSDIPDDEKLLCKKALLDIDLCFLGTIDAFCNMVLSENPIEAGIPLNVDVVEDEEYSFLIANEYRSIINNISKENEPYLDEFLRFQSKPKQAFVYCVKTLLKKRNYSFDVKGLDEIKKREDTFYKTYQQSLRTLVANIIKDDYAYIDLKNKGSAECKELLQNSGWEIMEDWSERPSSIMNIIKKLSSIHILPSFPYATVDFSEYFDLPPKGKFYRALENDGMLDTILKEYQSIQYDYTLAFISKCLSIVSENLINKGKLTFFDYLLLFRNLLKKDAANGGELIKKINNRHKYYLVDEFQDTDPLQAEIIFYLTAETPNEDFTLCKPTKGTLFIVGDPKQSIYRFRNADVVSYNAVKQMFKDNGDLVINLTSNFRTHKKLIDYFNVEFDNLFKSIPSESQAKFDKVDYEEDVKNRKNPIVEGLFEYDSTPETEVDNVANIIHNLKKKGYEYRDFMVLTKTKEKLEDFINKFDDDHIPYEIIGKSVFDQCEPFKKIYYLFAALGNSVESFHAYKAIKYLFNMEDEYIYSIFKGEKINIKEDCKDTEINKLISFYKKYINEDIIYVFDKAIEEFDLLRNSSTKHLEYLYYAKELLRNKVSNGEMITFKDAYKFLDNIINDKDVEKSLSLSKEFDDNRVLLANVHKVKGLERRIVILTSTSNRKEIDQTSKININSSYEDKKIYIIKIEEKEDNNITIKYIETDDYKAQAQAETEALMCEEQRIAYVAATRAADALFISSNSLNKDNKIVVPWGYLIPHDIVDSHIIRDDSLTHKVEKEDPKDVLACKLENEVLSFDDSTFTDKTYSIVSPSKLIHKMDDAEHNGVKTINKDATLKGTLIHRLMELYVSSKFKDDIDAFLNIINGEYPDSISYNENLKDVYNTIKNGGYKQENGFEDDLISILKKADEIYTEIPFAYKEGDSIYNGIIDLLYKKDNEWIIVDYKTNFDPTELDKKYENQLEAYIKALQTQGIEAKAYIYHINAI